MHSEEELTAQVAQSAAAIKYFGAGCFGRNDPIRWFLE